MLRLIVSQLIDFGFAKKIPYVVESNGQSQICVKSYTLCGTPEYLAPEFIFNSGHDHTVDLWAVGVLFYEMIMGRTPFAPADADDMTALLANIAHVHRGGLVLPQELHAKCGEGSAIPDLLLKLLNANPTQRLGDKAKGTGDILNAPPFSDVDVEVRADVHHYQNHSHPDRCTHVNAAIGNRALRSALLQRLSRLHRTMRKAHTST
jgi:cGMP-dependent protein kinase